MTWQWRIAVARASDALKANYGLNVALKNARFNSYVSHIHLAYRAWRDGHVERARELLDDPTQVEFRGFEWHYLNRTCHPELLTIKLESDNGYSSHGVVFSPDGKRVASACLDKTVKVWDTASGQEVLTLKRHSSYVDEVAFSPDDKRIASASSDKTVKVWDAATGKELLTFKGHSGTDHGFVHSVAFSPDGKRIASASYDTVKVWDAESGKELLTLRSTTPTAAAWRSAPTATRIASASSDETVKVWTPPRVRNS